MFTQVNTEQYTEWYVSADAVRYEHGVANIKAVYNMASIADRVDGINWYPMAYQAAAELALRYNLPLRATAAVIAALSPQMTWAKNVEAAETVLKMAQAGAAPNEYSVPTYPANKEKAHRIALGADPATEIDPKSSPKVYSFWQNICDPESDYVTIDRHAIKIWAGFQDGGSVRFPRSIYAKVAADYRQAAQELGVTPAALQAVTWVVYKRIVNR